MFGKKFWATVFRRPYVEIISENFTPADGFELKLDWNGRFITELGKAGIEADSEEEMVQIWLQSLMRQQDIDEYEEGLMILAEAQQKQSARENNEL